MGMEWFYVREEVLMNNIEIDVIDAISNLDVDSLSELLINIIRVFRRMNLI